LPRQSIVERTLAEIRRKLGQGPKKKAIKYGLVEPPKDWKYGLWHGGQWHWLMDEVSSIPGQDKKRTDYVLCLNLYHDGGPFYQVQRTRVDGTVQELWKGMSEQKAFRVCRQESGKR